MTEVRSFTELVPYMTLLSDGVVVCKDSGLLATFEISGRDFESVTNSEKGALLRRLEDALSTLKRDNWKVWFTVKRFNDTDYPELDDRLSDRFALRLLDEQSRDKIEQMGILSSRVYVSFYLAPFAYEAGRGRKVTLSERIETVFKRTGMLLDEADTLRDHLSAFASGLKAGFTSTFSFAYKAHELYAALERFERDIEQIEMLLDGIGLKRLKGKAFLGFLRSHVSGYALPTDEVNLSDWDWFLDSLLPDSKLEVGRDYLRIGDRLVSALSIKEWPANSNPNLVPALLASGIETTYSCAFSFMSSDDAKSFLSRIRGYADLVKFSPKGYLSAAFNGREPSPDKADRHALDMIEDVEEAKRYINADAYSFGLMNITILVHERIYAERGDTEEDAVQRLMEKTRYVQQALVNMYPGVIREEEHLLSAYAGTLPGQWYEPVRWAFLHTGNLADSAPIFNLYEGQRQNAYLTEHLKRPCEALAVFPTVFNTPFYFNFHDGALAHTFVVGPSRSGKSVMMNYLNTMWLRYGSTRVIVFDKDRTSRIPTLMNDGVYFEMSAGSSMKLNPISLCSDSAHHSFLVSWLINLIESRGYHVTAEDESEVFKAVEATASLSLPEERTLSALIVHLPERLQVQLETFTRGQAYGDYFDNEEDHFSLAAFTGFEMGELLENSPVVARAFIDYAFYRIMDDLKNSGDQIRPTLIYLEECWFLFDDERFRKKIKNWLKTLAKYMAHVVMTTQSIEDMLASDTGFYASIRDNIALQIFLPNPKAGTESLHRLYTKEFGLTDEQVELVRNGVERRDYLLVAKNYSKVIQYRFDEYQLAVLRSDKTAQITFDQHYDPADPNWRKAYISALTGGGHD